MKLRSRTKPISLVRAASEAGQLYASVTARDISDAVSEGAHSHVGECRWTTAQHQRGDVPDDLIDRACRQECGRQTRASLEKEVAHISLRQRGEDLTDLVSA